MITAMSCFAQVPRFAKYPVGTSGASAYYPGEPEFDLSYSEDSAAVYVGEVAMDTFTFSTIIVQFKDPIGDDKAINEGLLVSYLDFLQQQFDIESSAGYGKGHTLESAPDAVGVIDYWLETDGTNYQVKGWVNSTHLAIMMIYGSSEYPNFNVAQLFLNGFRFPE